MKIRELVRQLSGDEFQEVISKTKSVLKSNALAELQSIPDGNSSNLHQIPMFIIATQSYRDQLNAVLDPRDCPPFETHDLLNDCMRTVVKCRMKQTDENN